MLPDIVMLIIVDPYLHEYHLLVLGDLLNDPCSGFQCVIHVSFISAEAADALIL